MQPPKFTVIVPTYGRPQFLGDAVRSVLAQTVTSFECLVVDDASPERVEVPSDPRVRVIRREANGGPAAARNTGIDAARGDAVTFLDDDDLYTTDRLEIAEAGLERAPVAICHARHVDALEGRNRSLEGRVGDVILDDTTPHCGATAVRREVILPFDEQFLACEDVEWWLRISRTQVVTTEPRVGVLIRRHDGPRHRVGTDARLIGSLRLLDVHADYFAAHRRARAFRWKRIGTLALQHGDRATARRAFARSMATDPHLRTGAGLARAILPARKGPDPTPGDPVGARPQDPR